MDQLEKVEKIRRMYDETDLEASLSEKEIEETDKILLEADILSRIKLQGAEYIKENTGILKF